MNLHTRPSARALRWVSVVLVSAVLAACGGGDDDPLDTDDSSDPVARYVGSWESRCVADSGASARLRADLRKITPDTLGGDVIAYAYVGTSCSGPSVRDKKVLSNMRVTLVGSQQTGGVTADRFVGTSAQGEGKVLMYTNGNTLRIGDPDSPDNADGYPTEFLEETLSRMK
jgi:hypothetical protein